MKLKAPEPQKPHLLIHAQWRGIVQWGKETPPDRHAWARTRAGAEMIAERLRQPHWKVTVYDMSRARILHPKPARKYNEDDGLCEPAGLRVRGEQLLKRIGRRRVALLGLMMVIWIGMGAAISARAMRARDHRMKIHQGALGKAPTDTGR